MLESATVWITRMRSEMPAAVGRSTIGSSRYVKVASRMPRPAGTGHHRVTPDDIRRHSKDQGITKVMTCILLGDPRHHRRDMLICDAHR